MAKRKKASGSTKKRSPGGAMTGMRSGFKGMVGGGRNRKAKSESDFVRVLLYLFIAAGIVILLSRVL